MRPRRAGATRAPALPVTDTGSGLSDLARPAREAGAEPLAREADALVERILEGRFYVACVGQRLRSEVDRLISPAFAPAVSCAATRGKIGALVTRDGGGAQPDAEQDRPVG